MSLVILCHYYGSGSLSCWDRFGPLEPVKDNCNVTAYILENFLFLSLWQQFKKEPDIDVIIRFPHTCGHKM